MGGVGIAVEPARARVASSQNYLVGLVKIQEGIPLKRGRFLPGATRISTDDNPACPCYPALESKKGASAGE